jgi:hypothetical protein
MAYGATERLKLSDPLPIRCPGRISLSGGEVDLTNAFSEDVDTGFRKGRKARNRVNPADFGLPPEGGVVEVKVKDLSSEFSCPNREIPATRFVPGKGKRKGRVPSGVDGKVRGTRVL